VNSLTSYRKRYLTLAAEGCLSHLERAKRLLDLGIFGALPAKCDCTILTGICPPTYPVSDNQGMLENRHDNAALAILTLEK
jgi:hypothetical protein